jgi:very-short-patch-repair endonuclease
VPAPKNPEKYKEWKEKLSSSIKKGYKEEGRQIFTPFKKGHCLGNRFSIGHIPHNKGNGKHKCLNCDNLIKLSHLKYCSRKCYYENMVIWNKGKSTGHITHTNENIKKMLRRNPKSSLEKKFEKIVRKLNLPYKFVGDGDFMIGKKCPDFIHLNDKVAIEVYYRKHKEQFRKGGLQKWKEERQKIFNSYGWKLLFFDETQVTEINLINIIGD